MSVIKGFFFDLDGTLLDTYEADYLAYRDAIKEVTGIHVSWEDFAKTHGQEMRKKLELLTPGLIEEHVTAIAAGKKKHYPNYIHLTKPNHALINFLASVVGDHIAALVTTAKRQNGLLALQHHGLRAYFSECVFGDEVRRPKPDPEAYLKALQLTGLQPAEVIAFEDAPSGLAAAEAAGIPCVQVRNFA